MTIYRILKELRYYSSYSDKGQYYTVEEIPNFDENGLWSCKSVHFSKCGTLENTIVHMVRGSNTGYSAAELKFFLKVNVQNALLKLHKSGKIVRKEINGEYVYFSSTSSEKQLEDRKKTVFIGSKLEKFDHDMHLKTFLSVLNEKQRRLYLGFESLKIGYGGDIKIANETGVNVKTVARGRKELTMKKITPGRIRKEGAGRPALKKKEILAEIEKLIEDDTAGDPMSPKLWTRRSTYALSDELKEKGIQACPNSVGIILKQNDYSLRANRKAIYSTQHPDRNRQFEIIFEEKRRFMERGQPIISVDSKKKEKIGNFKNPGKKWEKAPEIVNMYDFPSDAIGIAAPYGIYDPVNNSGTVIVGSSYDTPEFAVDSIEIWLLQIAQYNYLNLKEVLILCDCGGSNGIRPRMWKYSLYHNISKAYGIKIRVCHYPTGASKWNPVEHRLFSFITKNWQARPLRSFQIAVECICSTTTKKGLTVEGILNSKLYVKGLKVSDEEMKNINIVKHEEFPQWNYTIYP
jgi:hypothetical protein